MTIPLPQRIYDDSLVDVKRLARQGKVDYYNAVQAVCQSEIKELIKQGWTESEAKATLQREVDTKDDKLYKEFWITLVLAQWGLNGKLIYRFDKTLIDILAGDDTDLDIPTECFALLPTKSFYIQTDENCGFFFLIGYEKELKANFFTALACKDSSISALYSFKYNEGDTLSEAAKRSQTDLHDTPTAIYIVNILKFVMYLAAVNAELTNVADRTVSSEKITRDSRKKKRLVKSGENISPTVYYVGREFGKKYEQVQTKQTNSSQSGSGTKKRPHIRRSHFHHYWTGSGEEKKLVVKWVHSVFVNGSAEDDVIPTVHDVKNEP